MTKVLYLIRGVSGSGKSTLANIITKVNVSADDYFTNKYGDYCFDQSKLKAAHEWCLHETEEYMKLDAIEVAVHNTFTRKWEMKPYYELAKKYGYEVVEIIVKSNFKNEHNVPEAKLEAQKARFEYV